MKYEKKNLLVIAAAGLLSVLMMNGCGPKESNNSGAGAGTETKTKTGADADEVAVDSYTWKAVAPRSESKIGALAVSGDMKVYAASVDGTVLLTAKGVADAGDDSKWESVNLGDTGFDGLAAGKAKMAAANVVVGLVATDKGVLVERAADKNLSSNDDNGVAYYEGDVVKAAWSNNTSGRIGFSGPHVIFDTTASVSDRSGVMLRAGVVGVGADQRPVLYKTNYRWLVGGSAPLTGAPSKLNQWIGSYGTVKSAFVSRPFIDMAGNDALMVDSYGVSLYDAAAITAGKTATSFTKDLKAYSATNWSVDGKKGPNNDVSAVAVVGNKLYIALKAKVGSKNGGVISYNITPGAGAVATTIVVNAADPAWAGHSVIALAKNKDGVLAVTDKAVYKVKDNGAKDAKVNTTPVSGITDAKFIDDKTLLISTEDKGIYYGVAK